MCVVCVCARAYSYMVAILTWLAICKQHSAYTIRKIFMKEEKARTYYFFSKFQALVLEDLDDSSKKFH